MKNTIEDLRNHLFATLEALQDKDNPMDLARAKEIANVARVIVESAKVEVEFAEVTGELTSTKFLPISDDAQPGGSREGAPRLRGIR
jgi:hypothetical protein